jgi:structural maintenance of chromosome 2
VGNSKKEGSRLSKEKSLAESLIQEKQAELKKLKFDPQSHTQLVAQVQQSETALQSAQERLDTLRAHLGGIDFHYADPHKGFNRKAVKGVVSKLFHIKPDFGAYHRALEVCAGGRLFFVVVDNEETGKALLDKGQLRRRVTIIPLNKIVDPTIPQQTVKQARRIIPESSELHLAFEIIGFQPEVLSAMKYVFGGFLVCDTPETAKQVTFHPNVRVRSVTKDGDLYDPAGTITGGSAPKGGNILLKLQELSDLEQQVQKHQAEYTKTKSQRERLQSAAAQYNALERELKCKEHEFTLIEERISRSEHHEAEKTLQDAQALLAQTEADLKALPEEKKQLEKTTKQLEKDIKNLESSREGRIKYFEEQVERLKGEAKKHAEKLEKQREKTEQATAEYEVIRDELQAQENQDQASGTSNSDLEADVQKLKELLEKSRADLAAMSARSESLTAEIRELDSVVGNLDNELKANKKHREERELEQRRLNHKMQQLEKDDKESSMVVARMEKQYPWIEKEKGFFGKAGTDFDFKANNYQENKTRLDEINHQQKALSKNINKKAMAMFEKAEQEYKDLLQKRDIILNDKCKIEHVIRDLDEKKGETLRRTWAKVNRDFDSIFSTLLPNTNAKLEPAEGGDPTLGLEIKVAFNGVWKQSLTELSGGQRSLLALSLVLALLLFKPAPMYILDEIDSALDLSHTQNIGHMIRTHFPHSQFIVVSLKEGMFNHANVLFRTRFMDGTSMVTRYAIRDESDRVSASKGGKFDKKVESEEGNASKRRRVS